MSHDAVTDACEIIEAWLIDVHGDIERGRVVKVPESVVMLLDRFSEPEVARRWTRALIEATDRVLEQTIDRSLQGHDHPLTANELEEALRNSDGWTTTDGPALVASNPLAKPHLSRYKWLLTSEPIPRSRATKDQVDAAWRVALRANHVVALSGPRLLRWADPVSTAPRSEIEDTIVAARIYALIQTNIASKIAQTLVSSSIPHVFLKGSAVVKSYEAPYLRQGHDIDVGVVREHLDRTVELLLDLHFCPADAEWFGTRAVYRKANPLRRFLTERAHHYELGMLVKPLHPTGLASDLEASIRRAVARGCTMGWFIDEGSRLACHANVDLHYGITGRVSMEPLLEGARTVDGRSVPSVDWLMYHSLSKIYWEGIRYYGAGLHHYCDLLRTMPMASAEETARLAQRIERDGFGVGAYYVLRRLVSEFGVTLPHVLEELVERYAQPEEHVDAISIDDHGDMWPKQWVSR